MARDYNRVWVAGAGSVIRPYSVLALSSLCHHQAAAPLAAPSISLQDRFLHTSPSPSPFVGMRISDRCNNDRYADCAGRLMGIGGWFWFLVDGFGSSDSDGVTWPGWEALRHRDAVFR
ncbi:hypothetical protein E2C01_001626 [Portunus trituberculatus]|uniref:Uncharacterized protein n=1 Tax=Portunus trituberculatus TaxID=210409 RepID=A0A5B7CJW6_PORTR|nr:hypothetical protein [Portunus trituberculatus]